MACTIPELIKILHGNKTVEEKCSALKQFRSNFAKAKLPESITDDDFIGLYKLLINCDDAIQQEACCTLSIIIQDEKYTKPNFIQSVQQVTSKKSRIGLFSILDQMDDKGVTILANDVQVINFINDCLKSIDIEAMTWLSPATNEDNLEKLIEYENKPQTEDEKLESKIVTLSFDFLSKIYKNIQVLSPQQIKMYDSLIMDKIVTLMYMGLKHQRLSASKVFYSAIVSDLGSRVRQALPNAWVNYKKSLQEIYWNRMCLLVSACYLDWATLWNYSIQLLGKDLHRGAGLINNLLSVEEKAFKSSDTNIRKQAFYSWKLLVDNFALDPQELASARRIKLLCIPLIAKNSKTEMIALAKFEVWWHLIVKVYNDLPKVINAVLIPFLNFCFGPLGDTPLLSSKLDICASPGKRFQKTKLASLDALLQFLTGTESSVSAVFTPVLEERIPHAVTSQVFQESYKQFTHSCFEALLIIGQFEETEVPNRYEVSTILWKNLIDMLEKCDSKDAIYKDLAIVVTEMTHHISNNSFMENLLYDVILINIAEMTEKFLFSDDTLSNLITALLKEMNFNDHKKDSCEAIKKLVLQYISDNNIAHVQQNKLKLLNSLLEKLLIEKSETSNVNMLIDMWCILVEALTKWLENCHTLNDGDTTGNNFSAIYDILIYPFSHLFVNDMKQVQKISSFWWNAYKQFDLQVDLDTSIKSNQVIMTTADKLRNCLKKEKGCLLLYAACLNSLITNINYETLIGLEEIPTIIHLINDLVLCVFKESEFNAAEMILRSLSAFMITVYGQDRKKSIQYLQVIRPSIEFVLSQKADENLMKEIASTWDTVVTIFKGLNNNLTYDLLSSFQKSIVLALCHTCQEIISQALVILGLAENVDEKSRKLLGELGNITKTSMNIDSIGENKSKHTKIAGSFLNRKSIGKSDNFVSPSTVKVNDTSLKKSSNINMDLDSQDYVVIKSDVKFDVNRLTDHQKEIFKKRRDDIPALYNDLSQSGSQDSQELQKWFEKKQFKTISSKELCDSNKENKETLLEEPVEVDEMNSESVAQLESKTEVEAKQSEISAADDFEIQQDCPESKQIEIQSSSSNRTDARKVNTDNKNLKKSEECLQQPRTKTKLKSVTSNLETGKKGKRKADEDVGGNTKRKKLHSSESSDNESIKSSSENEEILNKRVKSEISRLQIDMVRSVFEPLPNRRRSKITDCSCKDLSCKKNHSPGRLRSEMKSDSTRKSLSSSSSSLSSTSTSSSTSSKSDSVKKRTKRNSKVTATAAAEVDSGEDDKQKIIGKSKAEIVTTRKILEDKLPTKEEEEDDDNLLHYESSVIENSQDIEADVVEGTQDIMSKQKSTNRVNDKELLIKINKMNSSQKASDQLLPKETSASDVDEGNCMQVVENQPSTDEKKPAVASCSSSPFVKYTTVHISSPKGIVKRTKVKAYPLQGRAAQMLGLVTKQGLMEKDMKIEDEIKKSLQKAKSHEAENPSSSLKKGGKDSEKLGNQLGSRQVKIFSNMKAGDYCASPPGKLFGGLKNDGEKISPKMKNTIDSEKLAEKLVVVVSNEKEQIDLSPTADNDLPILEWSSANPPSLTASPSAGILKRHNQSLIDIAVGDESTATTTTTTTTMMTTTTPNKRKRVSFADPPVSQKMGYEVATGESPHKISRPSRHSTRRDTPLKSRQSRIRMFQVEAIEKTPIEADLNGIQQVAAEGAAKSEESMSDNLEFPQHTLLVKLHDNENMQVDCPESSTPVRIISSDNSKRQEISQKTDPSSLAEELFGTQEDMFAANDTSDESLKISHSAFYKNSKDDDDNNISYQSMTLDSVKFNTTNDSLVDATNKDYSKNESLENTVDVQNVSSFESTDDGGFCEKPMRCSTRTIADAEQDTLPVTDSVFDSIGQETQNSVSSIINLPKPETFDSTYPIFPSLSDCKDSIKVIVDSLANPMWVNHLETCLASREIHTVGDLAKLSEREINRIPFKGNPKVLFVKKVLYKFENDKTTTTKSSVIDQQQQQDHHSLEQMSSEKTQESFIVSPLSLNSTCKLSPTSQERSLLSSPSTTNQLPKIQAQTSSKSVSIQMELGDLLDEIDVNLVLESAARRCSPESLLAQFKLKMRNMPESELESETLRLLGINSKPSHSEMTLRSACKACGINKVLLKLPDIFSGDKQFFVKVLSAYKKKIQISDCLSALDMSELKDALCQKCKSSELAEMLSKSLKDEEEKGISESMDDLSDFTRLLKRVPADLLISHTVANDELIPSHIVLDIALQNSSDDAIAQTLKAQSEVKKESVFHKIWTLSSALTHVEKEASEGEILEIIRAIGQRLRPEKLLEAFRDSMKDDNDSNEKVLLGLFKVISTKLKPDKLLDIFYECMKNKIPLTDS